MWVHWGPGEHFGEVVGEKPDGSRESGRREIGDNIDDSFEGL